MEAANFVLGHTAIHSTAAASGTTTTSPSPAIKHEDLLSIVKDMGSQMADVWMQKFLSMQGQGQPMQPMRPMQPMQPMQSMQPMQPMRPQQMYPNAGPMNLLPMNTSRCNFCSEDTHFIARCPTAEQYLREGKIRCDHENKVILSSGTYIPCTIPGLWLKDRVDEWHKRNPGQLAADQLSSNTSPTLFFGVTPASVNVNTTQPAPQILVTPSQPPVTILKAGDTVLLTELADDIDDQVATLEAQILALTNQKKQFVADATNRPKRMGTRRRPATPTPKDATETLSPPTSTTTKKAKNTSAAASNNTSSSTSAATTNDAATPLHPFDKAKDAHYQPPKDKNFGSPPMTPIQNPKLAENVYKRILDVSSVVVSVEELLALAPDVRTKFREATTPKRVPATATKTNLVSEVDDGFAYIEEITEGNNAYVVRDTAETLYHMQENDNILRVAKESHALRSINMVVDSKEEVECIVDSS